MPYIGSQSSDRVRTRKRQCQCFYTDPARFTVDWQVPDEKETGFFLEKILSPDFLAPMATIVFITGGARSGKSTFAETTVGPLSHVLYVATAVGFDDEMRERIKNHRDRRDPRWETLEAFCGLREVLPGRLAGKEAMLFDCVTLMVTGLIMRENIDWERPDQAVLACIRNNILEETRSLIETARDFSGLSVIVSNEVGSGIVPVNAMTRFFRDAAGEANQKIAASADRVVLMTAGIPLILKGS